MIVHLLLNAGGPDVHSEAKPLPCNGKSSEDTPPISVIVPCRNERDHIGNCLNSLYLTTYPSDKVEILVVDGMSDDGTREVLFDEAAEGRIIVVDNPNRVVSAGMNRGIEASRGHLIFKCDAHATYPPTYLADCVRNLLTYDADNVGGQYDPTPRRDTFIGRAIVHGLKHPFGIGNSQLRLPIPQPVWYDTAYGGCYRREILEKVGRYDERFHRSEDLDVNKRIRDAGGRILLVPEIKIHYLARSTLREIWRHNFDNGRWIILPMFLGRRSIFSWRHFVPAAFVAWILLATGIGIATAAWAPFLLTLAVYLMASGLSSIQIALRQRDPRFLAVMPIVFAFMHFPYGLGTLLSGPHGVAHRRSSDG